MEVLALVTVVALAQVMVFQGRVARARNTFEVQGPATSGCGSGACPERRSARPPSNKMLQPSGAAQRVGTGGACAWSSHSPPSCSWRACSSSRISSSIFR